MKRLCGLLVLLLLLTGQTLAKSEPGPAAAEQAQQLLGPEVWSRVIRVENTGETARYPRTLYALIFEVAGVLWFYTDVEGTQHFSVERGHVEADRANFSALLQAIHPGFTQWSDIPTDRITARDQRGRPPRNACFIESLAVLRRRVLAGGQVLHPRILCYFEVIKGQRNGHAVLAFETARGIEVIDPTWPKKPVLLPKEAGDSAATLSVALGNGRPALSRWVAVSDYPATLLAFHRPADRTRNTAQTNAAAAKPAA